jgi:hypothetical protein
MWEQDVELDLYGAHYTAKEEVRNILKHSHANPRNCWRLLLITIHICHIMLGLVIIALPTAKELAPYIDVYGYLLLLQRY